MDLDTSTLLWKPLYPVEEAEWVIIGIPFERKEPGLIEGSVNSPKKLREWFNYFWTFDFEKGEDLFDKKIVDLGDVKVGSFEETSENVKKVVSEVLEKNKNTKILFLGGDNSISFPAASSVDAKKILLMDAHPDLMDEYEGNRFSRACAFRRLREQGREIIIRGNRTASKEEFDYIKENNIDWKKELEFEGNVDYVCLDVDVLDPIYIGTCAPEPLGYKPEEVINVIRKTNFKYFDIVEWVPDKGYPALVKIMKEVLFKL